MKTSGYELEQTHEDKSILQGERIWLTLDKKENISIYIYENNKKMEEDAGYISPDGFGYETGKQSVNVDWVSYPHFYKMDNIIVLYVGEDKEIIKDLEQLLGTQFAGDLNR